MIRSIFTCIVVAALVVAWPSFGVAVVRIDNGIDTTLPADGLDGPDLPHGEFHPEQDGALFEWDGQDGTNPDTGQPGVNYALVWFDIPQDILSKFDANSFATLAMGTTDDGDLARMHRVTVDWLTGPDSGNDVTFNSMPGGPGIEVGTNAESVSNATWPTSLAGVLNQVDVTADVLAWAQGKPNYGWAFVPTGGNGHGINSFEDTVDPVPTLTLGSRIGTLISRTTAPNTHQGQVWKYKDDLPEGDNPYPRDAQGDAWNTANFDDATWKSGPAVLGNGELRGSSDTGDKNIDSAPTADELRFGTVINSSDTAAVPRVTRETDLFRTKFNVTSLDNVTGIGVDLLAEDGAVVYINGTEVARTSGIPAGTVTTGTRSTAKPAASESQYEFLIGVFGAGGIRNPLVVGENTIAVELHQDRATSNDRGFDLELSLLGAPGAPPIVTGPQLQAGDADQDLDFDQLDLVKVQIASKYLTGRAATWGEGDWNGAPGGRKGSPPAGDGLFNQRDIIAAQLADKYLKGKYGALAPSDGVRGDGQTSIVYNPTTGEVAVDAPAGTQLTSVNIDSAGRIFTGAPAQNLGGSFDNDADNNIFKATFGSSFGSLSFGNVAQTGLSKAFVTNDLTVVGSLAGGGALGAVDLIYVPEPSSVAMLLAALVMLGCFSGRIRRRA